MAGHNHREHSPVSLHDATDHENPPNNIFSNEADPTGSTETVPVISINIETGIALVSGGSSSGISLYELSIKLVDVPEEISTRSGRTSMYRYLPADMCCMWEGLVIGRER